MGKGVVVALAIIGGLAVVATVSRSFWYTVIAGGPLVLGIMFIAVFLLGVVLGGGRR